jgi:hypothetical protein
VTPGSAPPAVAAGPPTDRGPSRGLLAGTTLAVIAAVVVLAGGVLVARRRR